MRKPLASRSAPPCRCVAPDCAERRIPRQRSRLPHRVGQPTKQPRIEKSKKKEKPTEKFAVDNAGERRNPGRDARRSGPIREMTDGELMGLVSAGLTEEESRRFKKTLPVDSGDDSASEVCFAFPRRIFGPFVLRNELMPAQASSLDSERSEDYLSETSSVGGASFNSEPFVTRPAKKTAAKESTATKAGQVRLFCAQPAPSSLSCARRAVEPAACITVSPQCKTENSAGIVVAAFRSSCQSAERRRVEEADGELVASGRFVDSFPARDVRQWAAFVGVE